MHANKAWNSFVIGILGLVARCICVSTQNVCGRRFSASVCCLAAKQLRRNVSNRFMQRKSNNRESLHVPRRTAALAWQKMIVLLKCQRSFAKKKNAELGCLCMLVHQTPSLCAKINKSCQVSVHLSIASADEPRTVHATFGLGFMYSKSFSLLSALASSSIVSIPRSLSAFCALH